MAEVGPVDGSGAPIAKAPLSFRFDGGEPCVRSALPKELSGLLRPCRIILEEPVTLSQSVAGFSCSSYASMMSPILISLYVATPIPHSMPLMTSLTSSLNRRSDPTVPT